METKFYNFAQNNSGGYFVEDLEKGICEEVIIESESHQKAWEKLNKIGDDVDGFYNYCSCCGPRWSDYDDGSTNEPEIYGKPVDKIKKGMFRNKVSIHYLNGSIKNIEFPEK